MLLFAVMKNFRGTGSFLAQCKSHGGCKCTSTDNELMGEVKCHIVNELGVKRTSIREMFMSLGT
jgi:hypothetical protein